MNGNPKLKIDSARTSQSNTEFNSENTWSVYMDSSLCPWWLWATHSLPRVRAEVYCGCQPGRLFIKESDVLAGMCRREKVALTNISKSHQKPHSKARASSSGGLPGESC